MAPLPARFSNFEDFFTFYIGEHSRPATRWAHFAGSHAGLALAATGLLRRRRLLVAAAPVIGYGAAWAGHLAIEHNRPATFGHPLWSLRGDLRMLAMMWQGRNAELTRIATDARESREVIPVA